MSRFEEIENKVKSERFPHVVTNYSILDMSTVGRLRLLEEHVYVFDRNGNLKITFVFSSKEESEKEYEKLVKYLQDYNKEFYKLIKEEMDKDDA